MKKNEKKVSNPKLPLAIKLTGRLLQFFSPKLATKFAVKLFATPFKFKMPKHEKTMFNKAKKQLHFIPKLNKNVMVYCYGNSDKKVLLVHGWSGRGTQLHYMADQFIKNGFMTISFDAPAHGNSEGKITMMTEFIEVIHHLNKNQGPFEVAVGHSLGGMAVLNSISQGLKVKSAVIISAGDIITDIIKSFVKKIEFKSIYINKIKKYYYSKFKFDIDDLSASVAAKKCTVPTLVLHDKNDKEVPVSCAQNINKNLVNSTLILTKNLGHTRILKNDKVIQHIIDFISKTS